MSATATVVRTISVPAVWTEESGMGHYCGPVYRLRVGEAQIGAVVPRENGWYVGIPHCLMVSYHAHPTLEEAMRDVESVIAGHETEEVVL